MVRSLLLTAVTAGLLATAGADESVIGIYVFHRHGDRTSKSLPPTVLTALGAQEVYASGTYFRDRYVSSNATNRIAPVRTDLVLASQLSVSSPVDTVLQASASVFLQALYPPAGTLAQQTLGNGTVTEAPLGGYQYIPISAVTSGSTASSTNSENSGWLQGSSGCGNAVVSSNNYFSSAEYLATLNSTNSFYKSLEPVVDTVFTDSATSFKNAYTIWDYIHVSDIHNATLFGEDLLTNETLFQLRTRADQHEWGLAYNASEPIRAISGSVLAAQILDSLNTTAAAAPTKASTARLGIQFGAYASFMSFFGLANVTAASTDFYGVVDYASAIVFELVTNATVTGVNTTLSQDDLSVRFLFSNGSAGLNGGLTAYPLFGRSDDLVPWTTFQDEMSKFAIGDTISWCQACGNTTGICDPIELGTASSSDNSTTTTSTGTTKKSGGISRAVAGVIGALVTLAVVLGFEALVMLAAGLRVVKKSVATAGKVANGH